jgi:hypothetical protein
MLCTDHEGTMRAQEHLSEVARLRQQIAAEYEEARRAPQDFSMVVRHDFITARQEKIGKHFETLSTLMPAEEVMKIVVQVS